MKAQVYSSVGRRAASTAAHGRLQQEEWVARGGRRLVVAIDIRRLKRDAAT